MNIIFAVVGVVVLWSLWGYASSRVERTPYSVIESKKDMLLNTLKKDEVVVVGVPQYAGYNAPWTPPWMTRNEVMVEIQ